MAPPRLVDLRSVAMSLRVFTVLCLSALLLGGAGACAFAQAEPPDTTPTTRNARLDEKLVTAYAAAIRTLNTAATEKQSASVARAVLVQSAAGGLDARFVLAALAEEGKLEQIRDGADGASIGGRAPDAVVRNLAEDLAERIEWERGGNDPTDKVLAEALRERAKDVLKRKPGKYADRVMRLYHQLSREDARPGRRESSK